MKDRARGRPSRDTGRPIPCSGCTADRHEALRGIAHELGAEEQQGARERVEQQVREQEAARVETVQLEV
jgi:hypothetical protein